jgi:hypothetical protein
MTRYIPERDEAGDIIGMRLAGDTSQVTGVFADTLNAVGAGNAPPQPPNSPAPRRSVQPMDTRTVAALATSAILCLIIIFVATHQSGGQTVRYPGVTRPSPSAVQPTNALAIQPPIEPTALPTEQTSPTPAPVEQPAPAEEQAAPAQSDNAPPQPAIEEAPPTEPPFTLPTTEPIDTPTMIVAKPPLYRPKPLQPPVMQDSTIVDTLKTTIIEIGQTALPVYIVTATPTP